MLDQLGQGFVRYLQTILENVGDGVICLDHERKVVIAANSAVCSILAEYESTDDLLGRALDEIVQGIESQEDRQIILAMIEQGTPGAGLKIVWCGKTVAISFAPVAMEAGADGMVVVLRDITQEVVARRTRSEFVSIVSHEMRTPLAIVRGYAEMLLDEQGGSLGELPEEYREPLSIIARRAQSLSEMVDDITALADIQTRDLAREPVNLAVLVRDAMTSLRGIAEKAGLSVAWSIAAGGPQQIMGDPPLLRRMLDKLINNAIKFTPTGGKVVVSLRAEGGLLLEVSDTGEGIPPEHQPFIFERFFQVDGSSTRKYGGIGLGLALVKEIAEAHGGRVTVTSQVGAGTRIAVWFPACLAKDDNNVEGTQQV
jgi:signal transduction histidine kinase